MSPGELEQAEFEAEEEHKRQARYDARREERRELRRKLATFRSVDLPMPLQAMRDLLREREAAVKKAEQAVAAREKARLEAALPTAINPQSGLILDTGVVDGWAAERGPQTKTIDAHRAVARWFYERVGRKPVGSITRPDVLTFKTKLIEESTSIANLAVKLSRLRTLLQWAMDNGHATENAAAGVTVRNTVRASARRLEFDLPSLNAVFGSAVFTGGARPTRGRGEAAYWLPLLALFTGARLEELAQLRTTDIEERTYPDAEGVDQRAIFILIREDEEAELKLKNAGSERLIPVHAELERLGLLQFVENVREAGHPRLFHLLRANVYGRVSAKRGEWFGTHLRGACGVTDRRMVFHSFRHTFKQYARHSSIIEAVQRQLMGHSAGDTADEYGSGYPVHRLVAGMGQYRVPGLRLPAPVGD